MGAVTKSIGGFIGSIPFVKDGPVDEFLIESGDSLSKTAGNIEEEKVKEFGKINNPNTVVLWTEWMKLLKFITTQPIFVLTKIIFTCLQNK